MEQVWRLLPSLLFFLLRLQPGDDKMSAKWISSTFPLPSLPLPPSPPLSLSLSLSLPFSLPLPLVRILSVQLRCYEDMLIFYHNGILKELPASLCLVKSTTMLLRWGGTKYLCTKINLFFVTRIFAVAGLEILPPFSLSFGEERERREASLVLEMSQAHQSGNAILSPPHSKMSI